MKQGISRILALLISLSFIFVLSGCYDAIEIDDKVYVMAIGVDRGNGESIRITIQYPTYKGGGGGEGGGGGMSGGGEEDSGKLEGSNMDIIEVPTLLDGINLLNSTIARKISLTHIKLLVISEDLAKEGIGEYISPLVRFRDTRSNMQVLISKGKASDFIKENSPTIGDSLAKSVELRLSQWENTGLFPTSPLSEFYINAVSPYESAFAIYVGVNKTKKLEDSDKNKKDNTKGYMAGELLHVGPSKMELLGTAVFSGDKMIGTLSSTDTLYFNMITGRLKKGMLTIPDPQAPHTYINLNFTMSRKPEIKGRVENNNAIINISLNLESDISSLPSKYRHESAENISKLNEEISKYIKEGIQMTIEKTQKELKSDIFGFGHSISGSFKTIQEWENYNWLLKYPQSKIDLDINTNVRRTGLIFGTS